MQVGQNGAVRGTTLSNASAAGNSYVAHDNVSSKRKVPLRKVAEEDGAKNRFRREVHGQRTVVEL